MSVFPCTVGFRSESDGITRLVRPSSRVRVRGHESARVEGRNIPVWEEERKKMFTVSRLSALVGALALTALSPATAGAQTPPSVPPVVTHTGTAPTGYEVT